MTTDPYARLDATAQADLVARKEVKPEEFVDAAIARLEAFDPQPRATEPAHAANR